MTDRIETDGLAVDASLYRFIMDEALPGSGVDPAAFWTGLSAIIHDLAPVNRALLAKRDDLQRPPNKLINFSLLLAGVHLLVASAASVPLLVSSR